VHQVQSRTNLQTGAWQPLANIGPFATSTRVVIVDTVGAAQKYYRLVLP